MSIRQVRRKESSITIQHPSTSLHLVQIAKFIQDYQHARMVYNINLNTAIVQTMLAETEQSQQEFNMSLDVPYIQSEHYESNNTFTDEQHIEQSSHQNFTDEEDEIQGKPIKQKIVVLQDVHQEYKQQDFKFVSRNSKTQQNSNTSFPFNSTKHSYAEEKQQTGRNEDIEIYRMQQTAYFSQAPQNDRRLSMSSMHESSKQNKPFTHNRNDQPKRNTGWSKKAMFLNKIQKQKSRKEIAEQINRQRHHLKRYLK